MIIPVILNVSFQIFSKGKGRKKLHGITDEHYKIINAVIFKQVNKKRRGDIIGLQESQTSTLDFKDFSTLKNLQAFARGLIKIWRRHMMIVLASRHCGECYTITSR